MSTQTNAERLEIPRSFGPKDATAWFTAWGRVREVPALVLVLPSSTWIEPAGLSWLCAGIAGRSHAGKSTSIEFDPDAGNTRYLQRIDFFRVLGIPNTEAFERRAPDGRFVELRRIESERVAEDLARDTVACLEVQLENVPSSVRRAAKLIFEELGVNVVQHSNAPRTGFGLAQAYPVKRRLQISFSDAGVGFLASVQRHPEFAGRIDDEGDALQLALNEGVSFSDSKANMGWGLGLLRSFSDQLSADLWVASGDALLHRRTVAGQRVSAIRATSGWKGAWVCIDAPLPDSRRSASGS